MSWDDGEWDALVGDLYLSAFDREAGERVPGRLMALTGGVVASMWRLRARDNALVDEPVTNVASEAVASYRAHYYQYDPWAGAVRKARFNGAFRGSEILDDSAFERSVYYNEFAVEHEMFHLVGALVPLGRGAAETVGAVSVIRPRSAGAFEDGALAAVERAVPHIRGAFHLRKQAVVMEAGLRLDGLDAALESFGVAALVLDGHGVAVRMNARAEAMASVQDGLVRRGSAQGVLRLRLAGGEKLAGVVAAAARGGAGGSFRLGDETGAYVATVMPLRGLLGAVAGPVGGRVLLLLRRLERERAGLAAAVATLFGLTEAEAEVAAALAEGLSPAEIAVGRGVKVSTVRTLLQRAQEKMDCRNLRDLVRVLMGVPVGSWA